MGEGTDSFQVLEVLKNALNRRLVNVSDLLSVFESFDHELGCV